MNGFPRAVAFGPVAGLGNGDTAKRRGGTLRQGRKRTMKAIDLVLGLLVTCAVIGAAAFGVLAFACK